MEGKIVLPNDYYFIPRQCHPRVLTDYLDRSVFIFPHLDRNYLQLLPFLRYGHLVRIIYVFVNHAWQRGFDCHRNIIKFCVVYKTTWKVNFSLRIELSGNSIGILMCDTTVENWA